MSEEAISQRAAIRRLLDAWRGASFSDAGGAAVALVCAYAAGENLMAAVPESFLVRNGCEAEDVATLAADALKGVRIAVEHEQIIPPEEIDSFARVADIGVHDVAKIPQPLDFAEIEVKDMLLSILGAAELPGDWGGERSDAFNTHVVLDGRRIASSFVLKGRKRGLLTPASYGKNGDQLGRSFTQPASLHIIQANAELASSVHEAVRAFVTHARAGGDDRAVASLWNGTDTARILLAYGKIDASGARVRTPPDEN